MMASGIDPRQKFAHLYSRTQPNVALTYEWTTPFSRIETFLNPGSLEATQTCLKASGRPEVIPTDLDDLSLWIDILFVDQNANTETIAEQLDKAALVYQGAEHHFVIGTRRVLSRCWCLQELLYRLLAKKSFIFLRRDPSIYRYEEHLDIALGIQDAMVGEAEVPNYFDRMEASVPADKEHIGKKILTEYKYGVVFNTLLHKSVLDCLDADIIPRPEPAQRSKPAHSPEHETNLPLAPAYGEQHGRQPQLPSHCGCSIV